jgi:hypothetical protein
MRLLLAILALVLSATSAQGGSAEGADFPISEIGGIQVRPSLAYDENRDRFFSTWQDLRNDPKSGIDIYGRFLDGRGQPVSADIPITRARGSQGFSASAFDSANDRFLVVWTDWRDAVDIDSDIFGRLVNADGTPHGEEFRIAARRGVSQKFPNLTFDPVRRRFLVVWVDSRTANVDKIFGRFVGADGDLEGGDFALALEGNEQDSPSLLFDPRYDQFFVVWRDTRENRPERLVKAVIGTYVHAERGPLGTSFLISLEKNGCTPLSLKAASFAPGEDTYFVAWSAGRDYYRMMPSEGGWPDRQNGLDVYGAFVRTGDGTLSKAPFMIASEIDYQEAPAVAYDPNRDRFMIVWYDLRRPPTGRSMDIYGKYMSTRGTLSEEFLISDAGAPGIRWWPSVAFSPKSDSFLVLWEDWRNRHTTGRQVFGRIE